MAPVSRLWKMSPLGFLRSTPYKPQSLSASPLQASLYIDESECVEEERAPNYNPKHFYPMQVYDILANRYQVAFKLGWGTSSTVWLARDLRQWRWLSPRYVAIKVSADQYKSKEGAEKELQITQHITRTKSTDDGPYFIRTLLDSFDLRGPHGNHVCMVFKPLYQPLWILKRQFQGEVIPFDILNTITRMVLMGLDYLHTQSHIVHTDLKSDNILMAFSDSFILERAAQEEIEHPLPRKTTKDRTIYLARNYFGFRMDSLGVPVITDFGLSVYGDKGPHNHEIQPDGYRAPEVIIGANWSYSADIWNLGALIWELLTGELPFDYSKSSSDSSYSEEKYLASVISSIGPPPKDMLKQGSRSSRYFDDDGHFKFPDLISKDGGFEKRLTVIEGDEKQMFLNFISRLLRWRPEERPTAGELTSDPWLAWSLGEKQK